MSIPFCSISNRNENGRTACGRIIFLICAAILLIAFISTAVSPVAAADQKYIVMYIVGSDLESGSNEATDNLNDLVKNWNENSGDFLVFYGGSDKTGWRDSIAVANYDKLWDDLEDGIIGADESGQVTTHVIERIDKDISTADALAECLRYADRYAAENDLNDADRYIILWNHGTGYMGFGRNEITGSLFQIDDISRAFAASGTRPYNILAFDACLMASIEVAEKLSPYGRYMLASEEIASGFGYDYAAIARTLSSNPSISEEEMGKAIITSYLAQNDRQMTMSLVRLQNTRGVTSAIETMGRELYNIVDDSDSLATLGYVLTKTQGFGTQKGELSEIISMDIYEFADKLSQYSEGSLHDSARGVTSAIDGYVVYAGDNGYFTSAKGASIAIPSEDVLDNPKSYTDLGGNYWYSFMTQYINLAGTDSVPHASFTDDADSKAQSKSIRITGTPSLHEAVCDYLYLDGGRYIRIGQVPLEELMTTPQNSGVWTEVPSGVYAEPDWDCRWFVLKSPSGTILPVSLEYEGTYTGDNGEPEYMYYIFGNFTRNVKGTAVTKESYITVIVDPADMKVTDIYVNSNDDESAAGKYNYWGNGDILKGDVFKPDISVYDSVKDEMTDFISDKSFTFGDNPANDLVAVELDENRCFWITEVIDWMNNEYYFFEPDLLPLSEIEGYETGSQTGSPNAAASPLLPITSVIACLGAAACAACAIRKHE